MTRSCSSCSCWCSSSGPAACWAPATRRRSDARGVARGPRRRHRHDLLRGRGPDRQLHRPEPHRGSRHVRPVDDLAPADRGRLRDDAIACRRRRDRRALDDAGGHLRRGDRRRGRRRVRRLRGLRGLVRGRPGARGVPEHLPGADGLSALRSHGDRDRPAAHRRLGRRGGGRRRVPNPAIGRAAAAGNGGMGDPAVRVPAAHHPDRVGPTRRRARLALQQGDRWAHLGRGGRRRSRLGQRVGAEGSQGRCDPRGHLGCPGRARRGSTPPE